MITAVKILFIITIWILYGGMITLACIYDGIYIQVVIDTAIMIISAILGYWIKASEVKNTS